MILERRIITGLIVSADYLRRVAPFWSDELVEAPEMRRIARWCLDHFKAYQRAPDRDIEQIYLRALREEVIPKAEAELVEGILRGVSDDYERGEQFNSAYLFDQTVSFFRERELTQHQEAVQDLIDRGRIAEATVLSSSFVPRSWVTGRGLDLGTEPGYERVRLAFEQTSTPVVRYPGTLGEILNSHMIRDGFVAFMGPEKRGKTFLLTDIALRALRQKGNVAFFQAGDLSESQMLRRIAIRLARRSDDPRSCEPRWVPVGDCVLNQFDQCRRSDRNCDHGVFEEAELAAYDEDPTAFQRLPVLSARARSDPDYRPCDSSTCSRHRPAAWVRLAPAVSPLTGREAEDAVREFFERYRRRFRLATYPSGTLTCDEMWSCLDEWYREDDFVPDVVAVDYVDLMTDPEREFRHRQNEIWKGLRGISQKRHALVLTATQTDADSYRSELLRLSNFSEDKRKYGHVTAMFGLNQDPGGREKELGILRINTIVAREGAYSPADAVCVLQDLASGRPFLESYRTRGVLASITSDED